MAGTGTQEAAFGGTSGATPMIAGSAALILEAFPRATPAEVKARLMNNAQTGNTPDTGIRTAPNLLPNQVAPATRIGAGEVRVDRAVAARTLAFSSEDESATFAFGYAAVASRQEIRKKVQVVNLANSSRTYSVKFDFREATRADTSAVSVRVPSTLQVPARGSRDLEVRLTVDPTKLQTWTLNSDDDPEPRVKAQAREIELKIEPLVRGRYDEPFRLKTKEQLKDVVRGEEAVAAILKRVDFRKEHLLVFAWTGSSKKISRRLLPRPGDNFAVIDLGQVGVRQALAGTTPGVQVAINTFGKRATPNYPAEFDVGIDADGDGNFDFIIFNAENGGFGATGQNLVFVADVRARPAGAPAAPAPAAFFFTDADLNSGRVIMSAPLAALGPTTVTLKDGSKVTLPGITATSRFSFSIFAFDNYFTGNLTDSIENMTFTLATPRFSGSGVPATGVPVGGTSTLTVSSVAGGDAASPSQKGLLLLYRDAAKKEAQTIRLGGEDRD